MVFLLFNGVSIVCTFPQQRAAVSSYNSASEWNSWEDSRCSRADSPHLASNRVVKHVCLLILCSSREKKQGTRDQNHLMEEKKKRKQEEKKKKEAAQKKV